MIATEWTATDFRESLQQTNAAIRCSTCRRRQGATCDGRQLADILQPNPNPDLCPLKRWSDPRLHVLTTVFNPTGSRRILNNYHRFRASLPPSLPVHVAEVTFGDAQPEIPESLWIRANARNKVWLKERLLNLLLDTLPPTVEKFAWIDADVVFTRKGWHEDASEMLNRFDVLQLFDVVHWMNREAKTEMEFWGCVRLHQHPIDGHWGHPGFAWAARRSRLPRFFDADPTGGADTWMADHFRKLRCLAPKSLGMVTAYDDWRSRTPIQAVGYVPGTVQHLWHGDWTDRRYVKRSAWIAEHNFDPRTDVRVGANGLWEWTDTNPELRAKIEAYFPSRKDDG